MDQLPIQKKEDFRFENQQDEIIENQNDHKNRSKKKKDKNSDPPPDPCVPPTPFDSSHSDEEDLNDREIHVDTHTQPIVGKMNSVAVDYFVILG